MGGKQVITHLNVLAVWLTIARLFIVLADPPAGMKWDVYSCGSPMFVGTLSDNAIQESRDKE